MTLGSGRDGEAEGKGWKEQTRLEDNLGRSLTFEERRDDEAEGKGSMEQTDRRRKGRPTNPTMHEPVKEPHGDGDEGRTNEDA